MCTSLKKKKKKKKKNKNALPQKMAPHDFSTLPWGTQFLTYTLDTMDGDEMVSRN